MLSIVALPFFALAVLLGLLLVRRHMRGQEPPFSMVLGHGMIGSTGLALLLIAVASSRATPRGEQAFFVLVLAALAGFVLFYFRLRRERLSRVLLAVHAGLASAALALLIYALI